MTKDLKHKQMILHLCIALMLASCVKGTIKPAVTVAACDTISIVSFSKHIVPILNAQCNSAGCHSGMNPAGNLNLEASKAYAQLIKPGKGYIDTLKPEYSVLYADMNSTSSPMPPRGKLDSCTINIALKWIQQKAKNN